jgi:hypothetical protein
MCYRSGEDAHTKYLKCFINVNLQVEDKNCDVCSQAIEGDCLMSKGKHFHADCMKVGDRIVTTVYHHVSLVCCLWRQFERDLLYLHGQTYL